MSVLRMHVPPLTPPPPRGIELSLLHYYLFPIFLWKEISCSLFTCCLCFFTKYFFLSCHVFHSCVCNALIIGWYGLRAFMKFNTCVELRNRSDRVAYSAVFAVCGMDGHGFEPRSGPNLHQRLWTHLWVCGLKRLGCHADLYAVSRYHTRGKSEGHTSEITCKGYTLALKPREMSPEVQKRGISGPTKRTYVPEKNVK